MLNTIRQFTVGKATVSLISIGDIYLPMAPYMNVPEAEQHRHSLDTQEIIPIIGTLIQLPDMAVLVDAGIHDVETHEQYAIADYTPPPSLIEQLASIDVQPEDIDHIIITHRHWDHINGTTVEKDGAYVPRYPNAAVHLGEQDWIRSEAERNDPAKIENRTLRILDENNVLKLISEKTAIGEHIQIVPAPGETWGHQVVRLQSEGETAYFLGDIFHHPIEFVDVSWMVNWARPETTVPSREMLIKDILATDALIFATHIYEPGRLIQTENGVDWQAINPG